MNARTHETIRKALEHQRREAEDNAYRYNRQAEWFVEQGQELTPQFKESVDWWNGLVTDTTAALEWLHGEFYNEWGKW